MSTNDGVTGGLDLTVETLEFIEQNWVAAAANFPEARDENGDVWTKPVLRNGDSKTIYPEGETSGYDNALRSNDVVTVDWPGETKEPTGTEFDFDVEAEVDVSVEALTTSQSVVKDSTDWQAFTSIVERAILRERRWPVTDPNCRCDWRWLSVTDVTDEPIEEDNRNYYNTEITVSWYGYESLPPLGSAVTAFESPLGGAFIG